MLDHLAGLPDFSRRADIFLESWAPWMGPDEREAAKQLAATDRAFWTADRLGERLRLIPEERTEARAWSIRPVDDRGKAWIEHDLEVRRRQKAKERSSPATGSVAPKRLSRANESAFLRERSIAK